MAAEGLICRAVITNEQTRGSVVRGSSSSSRQGGAWRGGGPGGRFAQRITGQVPDAEKEAAEADGSSFFSLRQRSQCACLCTQSFIAGELQAAC